LGNFKRDFQDVRCVEGNLKGDFSLGISIGKFPSLVIPFGKKWMKLISLHIGESKGPKKGILMPNIFLKFPFSYSPLKFIS